MAAEELVQGLLGAIAEALPKQVPELGRTFVIPAILHRRLPEDRRLVPAATAKAAVLGIPLEVEVFDYEDETRAKEAWDAVTAAYAVAGLTVAAGDASNETFSAPAVTLAEPRVEEVHESDGPDDLVAAYRTTIRLDCRTLGRLSRATGLRIRYCTSRHVIQPPYPDEPDVVHVLLGLRPPGHFRTFSVKVRELFGRKAWSDGEERMVHGPTQWRGRTIASGGTPLFQVIGRNYYQIPLLLSDHSNVFERSAIWDGLMAIMAEDILRPPSDATPSGADDVEAAARAMADGRSDELRERVRRANDDLERLQREFTEKLREREERIRSLKALERDAVGVGERCRDDIARLRPMDGVEDVRIDPEDGLLVTTGPIVIERDGRRYDLGPFRIHLAADGDVAVWSEAPRHPKGHHHPHVDRVSLECFGDVTLAVAKLATGYRFADAVALIMRWLRSYRPETTLIPLEEFPSEPIAKGDARETKPAPEPLAAAQAAGSQGRPAGHADRRRGDRKPRRRGARQDGRA
jgi:hypothetical protein